MEPIRLEDWKRWQREGCRRLPVALIVEGESLPASWQSFFAHGSTAVLLESAQGGRYTYLCDRVARVVHGEAESAEITTPGGGQPSQVMHGKPLTVIEALRTMRNTPSLPHGLNWPAMTGGFMGAFGYDLVRTWERLPCNASRDLPVPLYVLIEPADLFIFDAERSKLWVFTWTDVDLVGGDLAADFKAATLRAHAAHQRWQRATLNPPIAPPAAAGERTNVIPPAPSFTPSQFHAAVKRVHDYIAAGDTYQVNLSLRTSRAMRCEPMALYEALRRINPSPYMGMLQLPRFSLVCGSPELLVRMIDGVVSSRPIAGTRPRGAAVDEDANYSVELLTSEKERAEHLMLVDLIRNDIGRVADYGSVAVREFMAIERYSHVMHIVSQVEGQLSAGATWSDVLRSLFPGGTITGCPKIRTMEIIEELEPVGRAFYTGALGWISYAGEMEMNIIIRSMLVQDGIAHVQAGAGIVADSEPERELDEAIRKAQALWLAWEQAEMPDADPRT